VPQSLALLGPGVILLGVAVLQICFFEAMATPVPSSRTLQALLLGLMAAVLHAVAGVPKGKARFRYNAYYEYDDDDDAYDYGYGYDDDGDDGARDCFSDSDCDDDTEAQAAYALVWSFPEISDPSAESMAPFPRC
ncbi:unnamed protein product, partial [Symbiodinium microadriaticum]